MYWYINILPLLYHIYSKLYFSHLIEIYIQKIISCIIIPICLAFYASAPSVQDQFHWGGGGLRSLARTFSPALAENQVALPKYYLFLPEYGHCLGAAAPTKYAYADIVCRRHYFSNSSSNSRISPPQPINERLYSLTCFSALVCLGNNDMKLNVCGAFKACVEYLTKFNTYWHSYCIPWKVFGPLSCSLYYI